MIIIFLVVCAAACFVVALTPAGARFNFVALAFLILTIALIVSLFGVAA